ncbi:hypothetical protein SB48_HM08orf06581 [Heyndrickxia coagulans]|uniref:Uncharacterized protein n=1 Tax=Heyndrickxia coagulans TaxID=1398 RepID=A0AAN0TAX4_HEYCO|nr:hypothetical protein SB48_HM08orf06581 [Heyndrickxia coagulans]
MRYKKELQFFHQARPSISTRTTFCGRQQSGNILFILYSIFIIRQTAGNLCFLYKKAPVLKKA